MAIVTLEEYLNKKKKKKDEEIAPTRSVGVISLEDYAKENKIELSSNEKKSTDIRTRFESLVEDSRSIDDLEKRQEEILKELPKHRKKNEDLWWSEDRNLLQNIGQAAYNLIDPKYGENKYIEDEQYEVLQKEFDEIQNLIENKRVEKHTYDKGILGGIEKAGDTFVGAVKRSARGTETAIQKILGVEPTNTEVSIEEKLGQKAKETTESGIGKFGLDVVDAIGGQALNIPLAGLGSAAPLIGTLASSGGSAYNQAIEEGATDKQATTYGVVIGGLESLLNKLLPSYKINGKNIYGKTASDKLLTNVMGKLTSNAFLRRSLTESAGEFTEEYLQNFLEPIVKNAILEEENGADFWNTMQDDFGEGLKQLGSQLFNKENLYAGLVGAGTSAVMGAQSNIEAYKYEKRTGRNYETGLTQNEQKVVDKEVESRITEAEANGKKLTNKQKTAIENQVKEDLQKGYISTSRIESTLGDNTYNQLNKAEELQKEINKLENKSLAEMTIKDKERLDSIREEIKTIDTKSLRNQLNAEIEAKIKNDGLLQGSYIENSKRTKTFQADLTKYDEKQQKVIQKAIDSGILNDTNKTHEFVDMVAKISADKGVSFDFVNNQKLKDSGFSVEGKNIDGFVNENGITLNIESNNALNKVVGHEITHVLEGTDLYTELQTAVKEYATTKGEWNKRLTEISERYKDVDGANFENELTSDLVGEYLFTDVDFVNNLSTTKPNVFKKVYEEIKYLLKVATAGSKEARQLERVKKAFDKAYKNNNVASKETNTKYSLNDNQGRTLTPEQQEYFKNVSPEVKDENGNLKVVYHGSNFAGFTEFGPKNGEGNYRYGDDVITFFTDSENMARTYTKSNEKVDTSRLNSIEEAQEWLDNLGLEDELTITNAGYEAYKNNNSVDVYKVTDEYEEIELTYNSEKELLKNIKRDLQNELGNTTEGGMYEGYVNITNPYVVDAKNEYWNMLEEYQDENILNAINKITPEQRKEIIRLVEERPRDLALNSIYDIVGSDIYNTIGTEHLIELATSEFSDFRIKEAATKFKTTNDIVKEVLDSKKYDGVVFKNIIDRGTYYHGGNTSPANVYVTFNANQFKATDNTNPTSDADIRYSLSTPDLKTKQNDIIQNSNPAEDDYHTWIRNVEDIKTFEETLNDPDWIDYVEEGFNPDYTGEMVQEALDTGKITVYSSYPIEQGIFVSPSRMEAESYSGNGEVYSKEVNLTDVAWIDPTQGQYAKVDSNNLSLSNPNEDIAPTGNYNVYGEEIKLQVEEAIAPLQEKIETLTEQLDTVVNSTEQLQSIQEQPYYHGTRGDFDTFDNSKIGQNYEDEWSSLGKGFYFTNDYNSAKEFGKASTNEGQVTVKEAKLDIKNPFYVEDITKNNKQTIDNMINKYELGDISNGYNLIDTLKKKGLDSTEVLKEYGYDGIIAEDEVMVFDANQIQTNNSAEQQNEEIAPTKQEVKENIKTSLNLTKKQTSDIYKSIMGIEDFTLDDVKNAISDHSEFITKMTDEHLKELKKTIRNTLLDVSYLKSVDRTFKDYVKEAFGSMRLGNSGTQIDTFYQEMSDLYPDLLPKDIINEHDQFVKLLELAKTDENTYTIEDIPDEYMEETALAIYNDLKSMNTIPKTNEIAPIRNDIAESNTNTPITEKVAENVQETSVEDNQNLSVKESNALKLQNYEKLLKQHELNAKKSWNQLNEVITEKMNEYKAKKNKNTQAANNILQQIYNLQAQRDNIQVEYQRKINNLEKRIEKMNTKEFKRVEQRVSKLEEYRNKFRDLIGDTSTWKDKKLGIQYQINTLQRNLRDIVRDRSGKRNIELADTIYNELQGKYNEHEAQLKVEGQKIKDFYQKMNINKWEDPYIQMLGEYNYNPDTTLLAQQINDYYEAHKDKIDVEKVKKVIEYARKTYDNLFTRVNEVLKAQGMKEIPYRQGYFPHFVEEKQGLLAKIFDWKLRDDNIPTDIAGTTENFNPERSWQSFNKHREGDSTTYSFMKGLDNYVSGALDWIYHIEDIQKRRAFENEIRWQHSDEGIKERIQEVYNNPEYDADEVQEQIDLIYSVANNPLNNFVVDFRNATNNLAGKKSTADRTLEYATNRKVYSTMTNISNRVSGNMIGGSISAALSNFIPITQSWGEVSPHQSLKAAKETIQSIIKDDGTIDKSVFLTNRLRKVDNLYKTAWDKVGDKMGIVFESVDNFTSQVVWRSKYNQNIKQGMSETEAIKNADRFAENVIAGRSKGNMPTIFNSKNPLIKMLTSFQVEVNNQYGYMFKDLPQDIQNKSKANLVKSYMGIFLGAYAYNSLYSTLVGRDVAFDPIAIIGELLKGLGDDEEEDKLDVLKDFGEDVAQNIPFLGGLIGGGRVPISAMLPYDNPVKTLTGTIEDVSKLTDPEQREAALKNLTSEWLNPVTYLALPFGGGQIRKSIEGLSMYDDELPVAGNYTSSGDLRYTVEDTIPNRIQSALFGKWANDSAQEYIEDNFKVVTKEQLDEMLEVGMNSTEYREYRKGLAKAKAEAKDNDDLTQTEAVFNYIDGLDLTEEEKNILVNNAINTKTVDENGYAIYKDSNNKNYYYDEENNILYDSKYREEDISKLYELTKYEGKDMSNYDNFNSYEEFDFSTKYPNKYKVISQIDTFENYNIYKEDIEDIKYEYRTDDSLTSKQKTALSKQRKRAVQEYIQSLNLSIPQKIMLEKMAGGYSIKSYEKYMFGYLESLDMTAEEKTTIHNELFK